MRRPIQALLIAASLLATACDSPGSDENMAASGVGQAENDADSALTEEAPTSLAFVQAAAMSNLYEIAAANIALDKAEAGSVRDFAQMMVTDHSKALETLEDAVGSSGQTLALPINLDADNQAKVDILQSLQGAAFDREYLSQQMTAHREALTLLKATNSVACCWLMSAKDTNTGLNETSPPRRLNSQAMSSRVAIKCQSAPRACKVSRSLASFSPRLTVACGGRC
mgnify:CR=1 FL=1